jgi:hypothetical protein
MTRLSRKIRAGLSILAIVGLVLPVPSAFAGGNDFDLDFAAAAPQTYNHRTGGGFWNDGTIGQDIVNSLATAPSKSTFQCGQIVSFLTLIGLDPSAPGPKSIQVLWKFGADTTGLSGIALGSLERAQINTGDTAITGNGGSVHLKVVSTTLTGPMFQSGSNLLVTVEVDDLDPGATTVVRLDVLIYCNPGTTPTGQLLSRLSEATVVNPITEVAIIPVNTGDETIPLTVTLLH